MRKNVQRWGTNLQCFKLCCSNKKLLSFNQIRLAVEFLQHTATIQCYQGARPTEVFGLFARGYCVGLAWILVISVVEK